MENPQFAAFCRRVLRAYARRVAAGDIEALPSLAAFVADVDTAIRDSVLGLRTFGYPWQEIAYRLGLSRQAVQLRYGDPAERHALDKRLREAGIAVTVATLVSVFADHHPGVPAASICPGCGFRYPDGETDCSTLATVRPLLYRRRSEDTRQLARLTPDQYEDLFHRKTGRTNRTAGKTTPSTIDTPASLFDLLTSGGD